MAQNDAPIFSTLRKSREDEQGDRPEVGSKETSPLSLILRQDDHPCVAALFCVSVTHLNRSGQSYG